MPAGVLATFVQQPNSSGEEGGSNFSASVSVCVCLVCTTGGGGRGGQPPSLQSDITTPHSSAAHSSKGRGASVAVVFFLLPVALNSNCLVVFVREKTRICY